MRTTLTLDADTEQLVRRRMRERGISFKQAVNDALLASGAPIGEMNIVRKHLSRVKGGQLAAAAWPARVLSLIISDVPGDDPALIASGPTVGDRSTPADARAILDRWGIAVPPSVEAVLSSPTGVLAPDAPRLARTTNRVIADQLYVSEETVRTHVKNILRKLNQTNRTQAVLEGIRQGLISLE